MSYLLQPSQTSASVENWSDSCPVCCMTNFKSNQEMVAHIEEHFNQKGHKFKLLSIINTHTHTRHCLGCYTTFSIWQHQTPVLQYEQNFIYLCY